MGRSKIVGALPRMPLQVLRYAISIAEHGSTLSAAQDVNLTSSALSRQISQLEHELGLKLFERHSRGMRPTSAGEVFIEAASQVLRRMDVLAADLDDVHNLKRGKVSIFASEALVPDYLMPVITDMAHAHPNIKVDLVVASGRQAEKAVVEERADMAVVFNASSHSELAIVTERRTKLVAVVSLDHPLAAQDVLSADDLRSGVCIALPPSTYATRVAFDGLFAGKKGVEPHLTVNSIAALKDYARSGAGVAIIPEFAVRGRNSEPQLTLLQLDNSAAPGTRVCLCRHSTRQLSGAAAHMLDALERSFPS
jgi:DNA-binding transcriptional LysR family regulator